MIDDDLVTNIAPNMVESKTGYVAKPKMLFGWKSQNLINGTPT